MSVHSFSPESLRVHDIGLPLTEQMQPENNHVETREGGESEYNENVQSLIETFYIKWWVLIRASVISFRDMRLHLYAQGHDGVDNVVVVLLEGLDGLLSADRSLGHDKLNVLGLKTGLVDLLTVILLFLLLLGLNLGGLALVGVVVGVLSGTLLLGELLGSGSLGLRVQVLNLGLTEDAALRVSCIYLCCRYMDVECLHVGVGVGRLVNIGLADNEEDLDPC